MRMLFALVLLAVSAALQAQNAAVTINVDATASRHPINPNIYGVAFASAAQLTDLNVPLNRAGGNAESSYNWQLNAGNRGSDWYYESIAEDSAVAGEHADTFIAATKSAGAEAMITVPMMGWVATVGNNRSKLASFSVAKYGAQQGTDWQWMPDAGNGLHTNGTEITGNDPNDASVPVDPLFQQQWVQHLVGKWGAASAGGQRWYVLDNEHSLWHSTHRDVHPTGATMDEIRGAMIDYATRIKDTDSGALVVGPEEWGWSGYFYSGYDQQWGAAHGWTGYPDRAAHQNRDYLPWLLEQLRNEDVRSGRRLLDVFTIHYYPQGGEYGNDTTTSMQLRRNRSTRSLWDPSYTDESWIGDTVRLIPRMHEWVDLRYPATPIGITEYNWGAESHMNGATAQADVLGIFGRESLDVATRWTTPDTTTPAYKAIRMYRNYDGAKSAFGDLSVSAGGPNPDDVATFAAVRTPDRALTIMVINKTLTGTTAATINLANYAPSGAAAARWQLASNAITHAADVALSGGALSVTLPPQSVTLFVVPGTTDVTPPSLTISPNLTWTGTNEFTVSGTATDAVRVSYSASGAAAGKGDATGTATWTTPAIGAHQGKNVVTVTAFDAAGNRMTASLTVDLGAVATPAPAPVVRPRGARH
jgi:hypothetical protein